MATFDTEFLPIAVEVAPGQSLTLANLLKDAFGVAADDITSVSLGYWNAAHLAQFKDFSGGVDPLRYWTSDDSAADSANASCVVASWVDDSTGQALPGSSSSFQLTPVASTSFGEISLAGGTDILPSLFLEVPGRTINGVVTVYDEYAIVVEAPGTKTAGAAQGLNFSGPAYSNNPRPSDIVAAAAAYNAAYEGAPNDNDCSFIAEDIAAAAGAALTYHSQSPNPSVNKSQGFWRVVYQGANAADDNSQWDLKGWNATTWDAHLEPGDIVRIEWNSGADVHCFTIVGATSAVDDGAPVWKVFDNEYRGPQNNASYTSIGEHDDVFRNGNSYYKEINPNNVTVYRLTDDDLYLITGANVTQTLYGSDFDDLFEAGTAGNDTVVGGGATNVFVDTRLFAAQTNIVAINNDTFTLTGDSVTDKVERVAYVGLDDAALWLHGSQASEIAGHGHAPILFADAAGALATWETNGLKLTGGGPVANPGADWSVVGASAASAVDTQDVVFQNLVDGDIAIWTLFGSTIVDSALLGGAGGSWRLVAVDDLIGDTQLLWRDAAGDLAIWYVADGKFSGGGPIQSVAGAAENPGAGWTFVGTGDFTGDHGAVNLLFENASGTFATWTLSNTTLTGGATLGTTSWTYKGIGDFTGDGTSDILFEDVDTGEYEAWLIADDAVSKVVALGDPGPDWAFKGVEDLSGDGKSNVLFENVLTGQYEAWVLDDGIVSGLGVFGAPGAAWSVVGAPPATAAELPPEMFFQNSDDAIAVWRVPGGVLTSGASIGNPGASWTMLGVGDFYGEEKPSILFENTGGTYALWRTNGQALIGGGAIGAPGAGWTFKAIGDFNGDGASDILLENASGAYATWDLNGQTSLGLTNLGGPGAGWTFAAAADFTGDGVSDLLFANAAGNYEMWLIGDNSVVQQSPFAGPGAGWVLLGAGDFDGYGKASLLFEKAGTYATWEMNGATLVGGGVIGDPGAAWTFAGIADLSGDHQSSILFYDAANGEYATWALSGAHIVGGSTVGAPGSAWTFKAAT
jgi:hypothetical protein